VGSLLGFVVVLAWRLMGLIPTGAGLATIALSVLFLGGVQLLTIGVLGEYISRIFDEVKARPVAVVQELVEGGPPRA
jgi:dolichol-phosphate mannosyltransferase